MTAYWSLKKTFHQCHFSLPVEPIFGGVETYSKNVRQMDYWWTGIEKRHSFVVGSARALEEDHDGPSRRFHSVVCFSQTSAIMRTIALIVAALAASVSAYTPSSSAPTKMAASTEISGRREWFQTVAAGAAFLALPQDAMASGGATAGRYT